MRYELRELELIVSVFLKPRLFIQETDMRLSMNECLATIDKEIERIRYALCDSFLNSAENRGEFVRLHQQGNAELMDIIYKYVYGDDNTLFEQPSPLFSFREDYVRILARLQDLLEFMQKRFEGYFHSAVKLPKAIWLSNRKIAKHNLRILLSRMKLLDISESMRRFVTLPLTDFILRNIPITFGTLNYLRNYQRGLNKIFRKGQLNEDVFCNFLININFNTDDFFSHYKNQFINKRRDDTGAGHQDTGSFQGSMFTAPASPPYIPTIPGLPERLRALEKSQQKKLVFAGTTEPIETDRANNGLEPIKLQTSFTVGQISLFIKMMCDSNFISNKTALEVITLVAGKLKTDTTENVSLHSLRNHYYTIEKATLEKMRTEVKGLQVLLSKY